MKRNKQRNKTENDVNLKFLTKTYCFNTFTQYIHRKEETLLSIADIPAKSANRAHNNFILLLSLLSRVSYGKLLLRL